MYATDLPVSAIICRLGFQASSAQTFTFILHCMGSFLLVGPSESTTIATGSLYFSQANQVDYGNGGGAINCILWLKSYGFAQVIYIV